MEKENIQDYFRENIYPRSYQVEILQSVNARIENHNRYQLIQMPVGSGQSFVISMIAMSSALKGKKVLIVGGRYADSMVKQFWKPQALDVVDITFWSDKEFIFLTS
jgi:type I site-specific restriction endonuclease